MTSGRGRSSGITQLHYQPNASYRLDLEIFPFSDMKHRRGSRKIGATHRYDFHMLVYVAQGACTQWVDFEPVRCEPGSLLTLRPGQAHSFGCDENWNGWIVLFRPEFLLPASTPNRDLKLAVDLERLPEHLNLRDEQLRRVTASIRQMREDVLIDAPSEDVHALLRYQLHALLMWLGILQGQQRVEETLDSRALQRFRRFQQLLEQRFTEWHLVAEYAGYLGYTEKSLTRATVAAVGMTAKAFIAARIHLEAKRLLVHTDLPVAAIAERLGFDEATNFSKFFRRDAGCTPAEFRRRQGGLT